MTTSYESLSSGRLRHIRRLRKMSSTARLLDRDRDLLEGFDPHGRGPEVRARVGHRLPHVGAERGAEEEQEAVLALAHEQARRAGDRYGPERADRHDLRAQVDRREAGQHLARQRADY